MTPIDTMAAEKKTALPTHMKVEFCKILEKKDGAYWVVLNKLFPPEKIKRVHQVVFKYERTKKCQLTLVEWQDIFLKCDNLQDFCDVVKKYTGQGPWIIDESDEEHDASLKELNHVVENLRDDNTSEDSCFQDMSPNSRDSYSNLSPKSKTIFKQGYEAGRRFEKRTFKATAAADETPPGSTINKRVFEYTPSTSGGEPGTTAPARRLFGDIKGTTRVPEQAAQLT